MLMVWRTGGTVGGQKTKEILFGQVPHAVLEQQTKGGIDA